MFPFIRASWWAPLLILAATTEALGQGSSDVISQHAIPTDGFGGKLVIAGHFKPKKEAAPQGRFNLTWPNQKARGATVVSGVIYISGATIDQANATVDRLQKSPADYCRINANGTAVEFSTHTHHGSLKLPLIADPGSTDAVAQVYLSTANGEMAIEYYLGPSGMSSKPIPPKARKKK